VGAAAGLALLAGIAGIIAYRRRRRFSKAPRNCLDKMLCLPEPEPRALPILSPQDSSTLPDDGGMTPPGVSRSSSMQHVKNRKGGAAPRNAPASDIMMAPDVIVPGGGLSSLAMSQGFTGDELQGAISDLKYVVTNALLPAVLRDGKPFAAGEPESLLDRDEFFEGLPPALVALLWQRSVLLKAQWSAFVCFLCLCLKQQYYTGNWAPCDCQCTVYINALLSTTILQSCLAVYQPSRWSLDIYTAVCPGLLFHRSIHGMARLWHGPCAHRQQQQREGLHSLRHICRGLAHTQDLGLAQPSLLEACPYRQADGACGGGWSGMKIL
jgi:hypothetical protein